MGNIATTGGAGGTGSDECTAVLAHVLAGETAVTSDSGDEAGKGTMTVNSLLSFSCAAYSGRRVLAKWQNPKAAKGKPYSGVYIRYSTSGYPGKSGGTQIYKGAGTNTSSEGQSQAYLDLPNLNTTYYLSIYPYVTCSAGEMTGDIRNATVRTGAQINLTMKGTQNYTIPAGYGKMDVFAVGGGGAGGGAWHKYTYGGGGGGGGRTNTAKGIVVSAGQVLAVTVGAGGTYGKDGAVSSVLRSGNVLCTAQGGRTSERESGSGGGSGGGGGAQMDENHNGGNGGTNGGAGQSPASGGSGGPGQGTSTKAFGEATGTLYSGGGGGGSARLDRGVGGAGGGGNGGARGNGSAGGANTGGGGGGAAYYIESIYYEPGNGGSGIVLIRLY